MTKALLKERAIELRKEGFSYNFIRDQIKVSKSTLNRWLSNIPFEPNNEFIRKVNKTHSDLRDLRKRVRVESEKEARELAWQDVGKLTERDLFMLGLGIYMGEGSKTVCLRLVNSDPTIIYTGITWFKRIYGLNNGNFMIRIHLYPDCDVEESRIYWSKITGLELSQFHPVYIDRRANKSVRNSRKLLFGTAHVTIRSDKNREFGILLMRRVLNSIEIAKNQAGLV
jgi:hypothetical protein